MSYRHAVLAALTTICLGGLPPAVAEESGWVDQDNVAAPGGSGTVRCESKNNARRHCAVNNLNPGSVRLKRQLSHTSCRRGSNWDVDRNGIWVDKGCRAEFSYSRHGNGSSGGGGASVASMRNACIARASREWGVTTSNLEITHTERQQNGGYRFNIQSKRTSGVCMVDRSGNVYRLSTY